MTEPFDLSTTYAHLGLGARVEPLPDFQWTPEYLEGYVARTESDGNEGRLVVLMDQRASWDSWERHPAGDELVVLLSGRADLIQEIDINPLILSGDKPVAVDALVVLKSAA